MGFSASPTTNQRQDPMVIEDAALGLRTIRGSNAGTDTSKLRVFGEIPYPLWAPVSSRHLTQDLTGKNSVCGRWVDISRFFGLSISSPFR